MNSNHTRGVSIESGRLDEFLDRLDEASGDAEASSEAANARSAKRYGYRVRSMSVELMDATGMWIKHVAHTRNISRNGVCFLLGQYVYPSTECKVNLVSLYNHTQSVRGVVARCRYVQGSARVYEVGVKLHAPVDVALFHRGVGQTRLLLADPDATVQKLVPRLLTSINPTVVVVPDGDQAMAEAGAQEFDAILIDLKLPGKDGAAVTRELRGQGYCRPIIAGCSELDEAQLRSCLEAGFTSVAKKPYLRDALTKAIRSVRAEPLVSSFVHDPRMTKHIDAFVQEIQERLSELERGFIAQDLKKVEHAMLMLKDSASTYGFDPITRAACELEHAINQKMAFSDLRLRLNQLAKLGLAARPVSCLESADAAEK